MGDTSTKPPDENYEHSGALEWMKPAARVMCAVLLLQPLWSIGDSLIYAPPTSGAKLSVEVPCQSSEFAARMTA
jgi:hypothetical protein